MGIGGVHDGLTKRRMCDQRHKEAEGENLGDTWVSRGKASHLAGGQTPKVLQKEVHARSKDREPGK